jgi:hypothetical protein
MIAGPVAGLAAVLIAAASTLVPLDALPGSPIGAERAVWRSLSAETRAHYCVGLDRRDAVRAYADAIAEGEHARHADALARRILREGCTP